MWESVVKTGSWQGEVWDRRKDGEIYPKWLNITAVPGFDGIVTHYVASHIDITERKAAEEQIRDLALYDPLTRLPNRRLMIDRLRQAIASSLRSGNDGALLFIDLDNFKTLNDTLGHDKGDMLLVEVGRRLSLCVRESDTIARLGGDEFVAVLNDLGDYKDHAIAQANIVCDKIIEAIGKPYQLGEYRFLITPSIGVTLFGSKRENIDEIIKQADIAMYQAKADGRNTMRVFSPVLQALIGERTLLEEGLRQGILNNEFFLLYQPQMEGSRVTGGEALVRWQHPKRGMVLPDDFIPLAEDLGLIVPLGNWVLETACRQLVVWQTIPEMADLTVAVNISVNQIRQRNFVAQVREIVALTGANPRGIA
jgi:diguanylate cyclase (GGDEF)-like protein